MTSKEYDKLSDRAKRIKIAEMCGYTHIRTCTSAWETCQTKGVHRFLGGVSPNGMPDLQSAIPDYLNDLNAMHEAWLTLDAMQQTLHTNWLNKICTPVNGDQIIACCNATAAQRCKAFALTMTEGE